MLFFCAIIRAMEKKKADNQIKAEAKGEGGLRRFPGEEQREALEEIVEPLLIWYGRGQRVLPWRSDPAPYAVWVSEVMLQQTRVEAVLPYFERFMRALPTIRDLAEAPEQVLLKLWEGLGYYNRVRSLQKAAKIVMERYGGVLPGRAEDLILLPGIGEYSAGAIASIAFGQRQPAVDGNVLRVVSRYCGSRADITRGKVRSAWARRLMAVLPKERPGDFNQALMELGATICLPNGAPLCGACPIRSGCLALLRGETEKLPVKAPKKKRRMDKRTIILLTADDKVLLHKREKGGLLAGLIELPGADGHLTLPEALLQASLWGAAVGEAQALPAARHIFTHIEWDMIGYRMRCSHFEPPEGFLWASRAQLDEVYALPSAFKQYRRALQED